MQPDTGQSVSPGSPAEWQSLPRGDELIISSERVYLGFVRDVATHICGCRPELMLTSI